MIQRKWKKNRGTMAANILDGKDPLADPAYPPGTEEYWGGLFSRGSPEVNHQQRRRILDNVNNLKISIVEEIAIEDIKWTKSRTKLDSAPGPDGVRPEDLRAADNVRIAQLYNIILKGNLVTDMAALGRTTLIPKKDNPTDPSDYRPITVTSVVTRGLHKILARRLAERIPTSSSQKGFKAEDGVSANLLVLEELIDKAKANPSSLYLGFIDFKKAFDSVGHKAILKVLHDRQLEDDSINYLANYYRKLKTKDPLVQGSGHSWGYAG